MVNVYAQNNVINVAVIMKNMTEIMMNINIPYETYHDAPLSISAVSIIESISGSCIFMDKLQITINLRKLKEIKSYKIIKIIFDKHNNHLQFCYIPFCIN
jgi:hypothetical protein